MMSKPDLSVLGRLEEGLDPLTRERVETAAEKMIAAKQRGGKIAVVTGSGPNLHEGVTTLIAELMRVGIVDAVTTSSAVVAHEMAGTLDRVKRIDGKAFGFSEDCLPHGRHFELSLISAELLEDIEKEMPLDRELVANLETAHGKEIIKAAGNLGYPMGLRTERISLEVLALAKMHGLSFEEMAGCGADERTMIGIGAKKGLPVLVSVPQLIGGGVTGLAIGDSLSITERAARVARLLSEADVILESAVALTQEIHDGPFETYTGHGLWSLWQGHRTYSLKGKTLVRIDLDPTLERVWQIENQGGSVQGAIDQGVPKTKTFGVPFRMEMSGFARLEGSIAVTADIGVVWPVLAHKVSQGLGISLSFSSYPQQTPEGQAMRDWIADEIRPLSRDKMLCLGN